MKTLIISALILGIVAAYFVFNTEKSVSVKNANGVIPAGIDIAKLVLSKALNEAGKMSSEIPGHLNGFNDSSALQSKLAGEIKSKIGEIRNVISDKAINLIKNPVENKISELFCPQK